MKIMSVKDFVDKGFLQEVNRTFFHPRGMALTVDIDDNRDYKIVGIQSNRDEDQTGIMYDLKNSDKTRLSTFNKRAHDVDEDFKKRSAARKTALGFIVEPIPNPQ